MEGLNKALEDLLKKEKDTPTRISLSLKKFDYARLDIITKKLEVSKQEFIEAIVKGALYDVEVNMNLRDAPRVKPDGGTYFDLSNSYLNEIMAYFEKRC